MMVARPTRREGLLGAVRRVTGQLVRDGRRPRPPVAGGAADPGPPGPEGSGPARSGAARSGAAPFGPPPPYPYVRLGTLDELSAASSGSADVPAADPDRPPGLDLVTVAGVARGGPRHLDSRTVDALIACERDGVPTVLLADEPADLTTPVAAVCWGIASPDPDIHALAEGQVGPERTALLSLRVDTRVHNPVGASDVPSGPVLVLTAGGDGAAENLEKDLAARGLPSRTQAVGESTVARLVTAARGCPVAVVGPGDDLDLDAWARVLAVVAAGTPVVAGADAPDRLRPALVVDDAADPADVAAALAVDPDRRAVASVRTRSHVLAHHDEVRWLEQVLVAAGVPTRRAELVSAIVPLRDPRRLAGTTANAARQTHPAIEVVMVADTTQAAACEQHAAASAVPTRVVVLPADATRPDRLNAGVDAAHGGWVAVFDDSAVYGPHHVRDLLLAARYAGADLVGRAERFVYDPTLDHTAVRGSGHAEHRAASVPLGTALLRRETALRFGFLRGPAGSRRPLAARLRAAGGTVYSTHRYDVLLRGRIPPAEQTSDATRLFPGRAVEYALPFGDGGVPVPPPEPTVRRTQEP